MLAVDRFIADQVMGDEQELLKPLRFKKGELHPTSSSPVPWS